MYIQSKFIIQNGNKSIQTCTNQYVVMFPLSFKTFSILHGIDSANFSNYAGSISIHVLLRSPR